MFCIKHVYLYSSSSSNYTEYKFTSNDFNCKTNMVSLNPLPNVELFMDKKTVNITGIPNGAEPLLVIIKAYAVLYNTCLQFISSY